MRSVREYIRSVLGESKTISFEDEPIGTYDADEVWNDAMDLVENLDIELTADKDLRFFVFGMDGVSAAAFTSLTENRFGFQVIAEEDFHKDDLIRDCLEEYDFLHEKNPDLVLEIRDQETVEILQERYGFSMVSGTLRE